MKKWPSVEACLDSLHSLSVGKREIRLIVLHHTWSPNHAEWKGDRSIAAMLSYWKERQTQEGWRLPPGGHFVVDSDGRIYAPFLDLSLALNSSSQTHANLHGVAIETVGNFDLKHDTLEGKQRHAVLGLMAGLCMRFKLTEDAVFFHRDFTGEKTCPGSGLRRETIRAAVRNALPWAEERLNARRERATP